jgi:hypothetical protein
MNRQDDGPEPPSDEPAEAGTKQPDDKSEVSEPEERGGRYSLGRNAPFPVYHQDLGEQYKRMLAGVYSSGVQNKLTGLVRMSTLHINPALLNLGKSLAGIVQMQQTTLGPFLAALEQQRKQWDSLFETVRRISKWLYPENWEGVDRPTTDVIELIVVDEGIPLAWVPGTDTLQAILGAPTATRRRQIIGKRWKHIASDCEAVLGEIEHKNLQCHLPYAMEIACALREGHTAAAQALAANLLDSILRRNFEQNQRKEVTTNKKGGKRYDFEAHHIRSAFTLPAVWRAYAEYWQHQGDPIPRTFGRHPSAHAVSRTQYSRVNAVIALMLVTSLLMLLDWESEP